MRPKAVISLPSIWSRRIGNYSWNGGDSWKEYIRLKQDIDLDELNKRIDMVVQQHIPRSDKLGITVMAKPVRDTYRGYDEVKRMRNIMLILGISIFVYHDIELCVDFYFFIEPACQKYWCS
mgnify:FL=1